jgi:hypothetical protein
MNNDTPQLTQLSQCSWTMSRTERFGLALLGLGLASMLVTAAWLTPAPDGLGTHTQLGLPGCTLYTILGIRCPACGMTTSWAHVMHGDLSRGLQSNVAGVLLCLLSLVSAPLLLWSAFQGKMRYVRAVSFAAVVLLCCILTIAVIEWLIRLASM